MSERSELQRAQQMALDQVMAGEFYEGIALLGRAFLQSRPQAAHAMMGAALRFSAGLAVGIGMRAGDFERLAWQLFGDVVRERQS